MNNKNKQIENLLDRLLSLSPDKFKKNGVYFSTEINGEEVSIWFSRTDYGDSFHVKLGEERMYYSTDNNYFFFTPIIDTKIKELYKKIESHLENERGEMIAGVLR